MCLSVPSYICILQMCVPYERYGIAQNKKLHHYLKGVVLIRSVEKLELMPMLRLDSTIRTTFVSSCNLQKEKKKKKKKTYKYCTINYMGCKAHQLRSLRGWVRDDNGISWRQLGHKLSEVPMHRYPTWCYPSSAHIFFEIIDRLFRCRGTWWSELSSIRLYVSLPFHCFDPVKNWSYWLKI